MKRFPFRLLSLILSAAMLLSCTCMGAFAAEKDPCGELLAAMTVREKVAQMLLPAFRYWPDEAGEAQALTELPEEVADVIADNGFGGVILFSENAGTNEGTLRLLDAMQEANAAKAGRPRLLTAVDQEGGLVTHLGQGTQMPGSMALGAANRLGLTRTAAALIGGELSALGFNLNFAPVVDVNSNPANPVIGIRSFSDDPNVAAAHAAAFLEAQNETGVISSLKHFPGHGDVDTDSHTGLPVLDKTYEELKASDLIPFQACIGAGAEVIMTAHICYPKIETETYTSVSTGEEVTLPATLSKTILTDILRGDMGYEGVIVTDAMDMDAIAAHFDPLDAAALAIGAGADLLLMPVDAGSPEGLAALEQYIDDLTALVEDGTIEEARVDAAVLRILRLKERHGLLDPYEKPDLDAAVEAAAKTVGSPEHHAAEWDLASRAVTLVKNDRGTLPIDTQSGKILVLAPYDSQVLSLEYAVDRLRDDGELGEDAEIQILNLSRMREEELREQVKDAAHVIAVSVVYAPADLDPARSEASAKIDAVIESAREAGADVSVLSAGLPYDVARYQDADALMLAWSYRGMFSDPRETAENISQYGPNLPAALYLMLCQNSTPSGILPLNIPALDEDYGFTEDLCYSRGFGLEYKGVFCDRGAGCPLSAFSDLNTEAWYHDGIHYMLEHGVMRGYSNETFGPGDGATRAMIVTILWRMAGSPETDSTLSFQDVPEDRWFTEAVRWAAAEGIVNGYNDQLFGPGDNITRQQLATILCRYAEYLGEDIEGAPQADLTVYTDTDKISSWAEKALKWACGGSLIQGLPEGTLEPDKGASRAEVATVLLRWEMREQPPEVEIVMNDWQASYVFSSEISADAEEVYNYLRYLNFSEAVSCGILANMECESGFVLTALGDGGTSYGLCQWHNNRWQRLDSFCREHRYDPDTVQGQLEYLLWELQNYETATWSQLQQVSDDVEGAVQASEIWLRTFERPLSPESRSAFQAQLVREKYWPRFSGSPVEEPEHSRDAEAPEEQSPEEQAPPRMDVFYEYRDPGPEPQTTEEE